MLPLTLRQLETVMRKIVFLAGAVIGLYGCASETQRQAAKVQCQEVGISQKDPQFDICTRAYTVQGRQDALETTYHRALNAVPDRKMPHQWYGF